MARLYDDDDYDAAVADLFTSTPGPVKPARSPPVIAAALFVRIVTERNGGPVRPCRVRGRCDWSDLRFRKALAFRRVTFQGEMRAEVADFTNLAFSNCRFERGAALRNCRIRGDLEFSDCAFPAAKNGGALVLTGTRVDGQVDLRKLVIAGALTASGLTCLVLTLDDATIGAGCDLPSVRARRSVVLKKAVIEGDLNCRFLCCGGMMRLGNGCSIDGNIDLAGVQVAAQLDLTDGTFGDLIFNGSAVGSLWIGSDGPIACRSIDAMDSRFDSYVKMSRLKVSVDRVLPKAAGRRRRAAATASLPPSDDWGKIVFHHCSFGSQVDTWISGRDGGHGGGWQDDNMVEVERSVSFIDCDIGGELDLTRLKVVGTCPHSGGIVRLDRTHLRGWLFISSPTSVAGRLDIPSDIRAQAAAQVAAGNAMAPQFRASMRSLLMRDFSASGVELSGLDLVHCGGNDADREIDGCLVGDRMAIAGVLATFACPDDRPSAARPDRRAHARIKGAMRLRDARIGELRLAGDSFRECQRKPASQCGVVLELAEIGLLRVPRVPVATPSKELNGFPVPLDLSGLRVTNWNFDEDVDAEMHAGCTEFLDFLDNDESLHREVYRSVAQSLRNAGRDRDAEKILYAEEYRAGWETRQARAGLFRPARLPGDPKPKWPPLDRKDRPKGRIPSRFKRIRRLFGWLGLLIEWFDRYFLRYRRNPIWLLYAILVLGFVSTLFVSSHAGNFELSEESRLVLQNEAARAPAGGPVRENLAAGIDYLIDGRNVGPHPEQWTAWNAVWMTVRYHIPIVPMLVEDEYVASNDNRLRFGAPWNRPNERAPGVSPGEIGFSAEDWFALMSLFNWIMWPLLLTFALRRALRSD